jgi:hypothetical protein
MRAVGLDRRVRQRVARRAAQIVRRQLEHHRDDRLRLRFCDSTNCRSFERRADLHELHALLEHRRPMRVPRPAVQRPERRAEMLRRLRGQLVRVLEDPGEVAPCGYRSRPRTRRGQVPRPATPCRTERPTARSMPSSDMPKTCSTSLSSRICASAAVLRLKDELLGAGVRVPRDRHRLRLEAATTRRRRRTGRFGLLDKRVAVQQSCAVTADQNRSAGVDAFGLSCSRRHDRC